jgi:hypothetical protein
MTTPSRDEIADLQRRLAESGKLGDVRASGALTLEDVAEASGVSVAEARLALEQMRAERAFASAKTAPTKKKQWPMAVLAGALFFSAWAIYAATPHRMTDEEVEAKQRELTEARKKKPKKIHYPIETIINKGPGSSLPGIQISFRGAYTITTGQPATNSPILDKEVATKYLIAATQAVFAKALEMENGAHPPAGTKPLGGQGQGIDYRPGYMGFGFGNTFGYIPIAPVTDGTMVGQPGTSLPEMQQYNIKSTVEIAVKSLWEQQQNALKAGGTSSYPAAPPGFSVTVNGRRKNFGSPTQLYFLPIDRTAVKARLIVCIRQVMEADAKPIDVPFDEMRRKDAAIPMPPFTEVIVSGPGGPVHAKIPTGISEKYPSAADAGRAAGPAIEKLAEEASKQVDRFKSGDVPVAGGGYGW